MLKAVLAQTPSFRTNKKTENQKRNAWDPLMKLNKDLSSILSRKDPKTLEDKMSINS